jgi:two-component system chemotaxis response regulator CheY
MELQGEAVEPNKILLIDDSKLIHKMFGILLRKYTLVHAMDGRDALGQLSEHPDVDLMLLDINMPTMNGLEFLGQVKGDPSLAEIPVIIVSTEGKEEDTIRGLEAGAAAYIKKPFQAEEVLKVITRL